MINETHIKDKLKVLLKEYLKFGNKSSDEHKHHEGAIKALVYVLNNKELNEKLHRDAKIFNHDTAKELLDEIDK